jgi:hypothetical protein
LPRRPEPAGRSAFLAARAGACLAALFYSLFYSLFARAQGNLRIGSIDIRTVDIFSSEEAANGWLYRAANWLHVTTRESLVRRLLLFDEGDPFDHDRLAETERNLRASGFFQRASVIASEPHDGVVDVRVETQDAWTFLVGIAVGRDGGEMHQGFTLGEKNLLGTGRRLSVSYGDDIHRSYRVVEFSDPQFLLPYGRAHVVYASNSDGEERLLELERPFYSIRAPWTAAARFDDGRRRESLYRGGEEVSRYERSFRRITGRWGFAARASPDRALRFGIGLDWQDDRFSEAPGWEGTERPAPRTYHDVFLEAQFVRHDYLTWNYVDEDLRYQDFNVGRSISFDVGVSPAAFGAPVNSTLARLDWQEGFRLGGNSFVVARLAGSARRENDAWRNTIVSGELRLVRRFLGARPQTLLARVAAARGWNLDADRLLYADGATGLRAYPLYAFEGDRRVLANVEHRIFCGCEIFQLVAPGLAVFVDAGAAAPPGESLNWSRLKADAGVGLRFAIARASAFLRVDLGYAFQPDPRGRKGWLLSFSGSQAF